MASNRLAWNPSSNANAGVAAKTRQWLSNEQEAAKTLSELKRILDKYNADWATLATDMGMSAADAQTYYNFVVQSYGEKCLTVTTALAVGATAGVRQVLDAMG